MKNRVKWIMASLFWLIGFGAWSQITISMANVQSVNVSPSEMCRISVFNQGDAQMVFLDAEIVNSINDVVLSVKTIPFMLESGMVNISPEQLSLGSVTYHQSEQGKYVQSTKKLPSGLYQYCVRINGFNDNAIGDSYCDEISSLDNAFLFLVNPENKEEIETINPVLLWMHSEPFDVLTRNEEFKLVLVELAGDQSAQSGISINPPLFFVNNVRVHNVQYSFDAPELIYGQRYGWQVQRISNGVIMDRTEAWEFTLKKQEEQKDIMYAVLRKTLDSGFYTVHNDKLFFQFDEKYKSQDIKCRIYNNTTGISSANTKNLRNEKSINYKENGHNEFELDLEPYNLKSGYYVLEVRNEKNDEFKLKFFIQ